MRVCIKEDNEDFPSVPPGFESYTSFNLKRVNDTANQDSKNVLGFSASTNASEPISIKMETNVDASDAGKHARPLRRKPGINYGRYDCGPEDDCDSEQLNQVGVFLSCWYFCF